jgi:amidohydrolase
MDMDTLDIDVLVSELRNEITELRRDFHMHPELGFQEYRTAEKIENYLIDLGLDSVRIADTGVVAVLEGTAPGPTLLLRADMDALPVVEENDVSYVSVNKGIMHACGHDAHMAILLGAAKTLVKYKNNIRGNIKFVFQPNEEIAGAKILIDSGVLENPTVDAAMGLHIWTALESGKIGLKAGAVFASMDIFKITITGKGGHTGYPEAAVDPVITAADLIQTAQIIQTREISLLKPTVLVFSKINAGATNNIIPETVTLEGSLRYLYDGGADTPEHPAERLKRIVKNVCDTHNCSFEIELERENSVLLNDPGMVELMRVAATVTLGDDRNIVEHVTMAGEDFSEFAMRVPSVFAFLGTANVSKKTDFPHHNSKFNIDEDVLTSGVELLVRSSLRYFKIKSTGGEKETD